MEKFKTWSTEGDKSVFVVGLCPGKQRKGNLTKRVWEGNRSGDFVKAIVANMKNLHMTNVFNYYVKGKLTKEMFDTGFEELKLEIQQYQPKKIICLGALPYKYVKSLLHPNVVQLKHPSYVLRFNAAKGAWLNNFLMEVESAQT